MRIDKGRTLVCLAALGLALACNLPGITPTPPPIPSRGTVAAGEPTVAPGAQTQVPAVPIETGLIAPDDMVYLGAFRLPGGDDPPRTFAYGGNAMTFNPDGGTLFVMGHDRIAYGDVPDGNQVAEIGIPEPVAARNLDDLPVAEFRQDFSDVTAGYFREMEEIPRVGMAYLNHPLTGPKIHLGWGQHLQEGRTASHAWFDAALDAPDLQGTWFIGEQAAYSVGGYLFEIPAAWADAHAQGRVLATGRMRDGGQGGMGPTLFAYCPWNDDGAPPADGATLPETTLLLYEKSNNTEAIERALDGYQHPDEWEGGAWLSTASGQSAVIFAGTKGTGAKYWYGWVNPAGPEFPCVEEALVDQFPLCRRADGTLCPEEDLRGCAGHNDYRGWWSARFDAQIIFYDPSDLARVAAGALASWEPQPYARLDLDEHLYFNPPEWDQDMLGRGDQRRMRLGDVAYDRQSQRLYVLELYADGAKPVVHVWQVR